MTFTFTITMAAAASAIAIPGPIQRPDLPSGGIGPIPGTDPEDTPTPPAPNSGVQPADEDWFAALQDPVPTITLTRRGLGRKPKELDDVDKAWLDELLKNVDIDEYDRENGLLPTEEEEAEQVRNIRELLEGQKNADQTLGEFSEELKGKLERYDEQLRDERIEKDNKKWHKEREAIETRKRRIGKVLNFIDRALTWVWAVEGGGE